MTATIPYEIFASVELRVGRIVEALDFPEARKPAYRLTVDFGPEVGIRRSSAQITKLYRKEELVGRQVVAVVNFAPKQIGPFLSECLVCGADDGEGRVALLGFDREMPLGTRIY